MSTNQDVVLPSVDSAESLQLAPRYRVWIHNDEVTTFEYVVGILGSLFFLSEELADHVAWTAHDSGKAVVVVRPQLEAEKLTKAANNRARMDGFPLTFTNEPDA